MVKSLTTKRKGRGVIETYKPIILTFSFVYGTTPTPGT